MSCDKDKTRRKAAAWRAANPEREKANQAAWRVANKEARAASSAAWERRNPEKRRQAGKRQRAARYGLTEASINALLASQRNMCPVCLTPLAPWGTTQTVVVDHCHDTGEVRGILCHQCNSREGWFKRHGTRLCAYLENPPARELLDLA